MCHYPARPQHGQDRDFRPHPPRDLILQASQKPKGRCIRRDTRSSVLGRELFWEGLTWIAVRKVAKGGRMWQLLSYLDHAQSSARCRALSRNTSSPSILNQLVCNQRDLLNSSSSDEEEQQRDVSSIIHIFQYFLLLTSNLPENALQIIKAHLWSCRQNVLTWTY